VTQRAAVLFLLLLAGCGGSGTSAADAGADAGAMDAAVVHDAGSTGTDAFVELGSGVSAYMALADGDKLVFNLGPQGGGRYGGYNIWGGVRALGVNPAGVTLTYTLTGTSGDVLGQAMRTTTLQPDGSDYVAYAISVVLNDCCKVAGRMLKLHLDFMDQSGVMRSDERHVLGADQCPRGFPNPTIDPCK
jgi:hypothetical protein